jgi:hypothetical protein
MSKSRKLKQNAKLSAAARPRRRLPRMAAAVVTVAIVIVMGAWLWSNASHTDTLPGAATTGMVNTTNAPATAGTSAPAFAKLQGKWLRPDGGYILEIRSAAPDGNLEAAYFNPRPIHVAKAIGLEERGSVKVFIELRDVNYPGSTYTLAYNPANDQLKGDYFQAALQQTFDVFFTRVKP